MADGLVTDPDVLPAWAKPGDQIYRWTDDEGEIYFVPATVFQLLTKPWRGQNNMTGSAVNPAIKSVQELCKDVPVLNINSRFQESCQTPADISTKIVLLSNGKQVSVYRAGKINTTKLTAALLKRNDLSDEVIH